MKLPLKIAWRYLWGKKPVNAIQILSLISALGMMVGTVALILVLSVYNGFENLVLSLYDNFRPDLVLIAEKGKTFEYNDELYNEIKAIDGINELSAVLEENALFDYDGNQYFARLKGVDEKFTDVNAVDTIIMDGVFRLRPQSNDAVVGLGVAKSLSLNIYDDFSELRVFSPKRGKKINTLNPLESVNIRSLFPRGLYSIEKEFDSKYIFVPLKLAQEILEYPNRISALEIALADQNKIERIQKLLKEKIPEDLTIKNRYEQDSTIYKVMKSEKWVAFLILSFILLIVAFNILGSLSMLVIDKKKDISILQAMGADQTTIKRTFLLTGLFVSIGGAFLGAVIALFLGFLHKQFGLIQINANGNFLVDALPLDFRFSDFIWVAMVVIVIGMFSSYFPAVRAAKQAMEFRD